jgi:hypothetical protein
MMKQQINGQNKMGLQEWRKRNRFNLQCVALGLDVTIPFALYWALTAKQTPLSIIFFAVLTLAMAITLWVA